MKKYDYVEECPCIGISQSAILERELLKSWKNLCLLYSYSTGGILGTLIRPDELIWVL